MNIKSILILLVTFLCFGNTYGSTIYFGQGTAAQIDVLDPATGATVSSFSTSLGVDSIAMQVVPLPPSLLLFLSGVSMLFGTKIIKIAHAKNV
ncbi:MAG: hypothetical protein OQL06_10560 [Gammaproteobacteria bacterium]|nr:hypothetical protein [Gammaproteobacteria bacterium]